ncbi:MAG TPA: UDP-N-acetylglucosamine 2-epimerase [Euzebyales bacterium]|nr:UDP-N-acetylglucosamine 2-epimerase [Euzebyales bacterium]
MPTIHVFLGTKAQYIKTAPLLRLLDARSVDYRLIDSGQHARLTSGMRAELRVRPPDVVLGSDDDVTTITGAVRWSLAIASRLWSAARIRRDIFGGRGGVCVVHGDTPSTLLAALLARRAGLAVAHLEAGLRSHSLVQPFPEEAIRLLVMRLSDLLFAPDETALGNVRALRLSGQVVALPGNTVVEALQHSLDMREPSHGPAVVTMHRVENLTSRHRIDQLVATLEQLATAMPVRFVLHTPTEEALVRTGLRRRLADAGVQCSGLVPHHEFVQLLSAAPLVVTDGGSIQEECALLGVPTLLWRDRTERPDGLDANVVLSHYDPDVIAAFLERPDAYRHKPVDTDVRPSEQILEELCRLIEAPAAPVARDRHPVR